MHLKRSGLTVLLIWIFLAVPLASRVAAQGVLVTPGQTPAQRALGTAIDILCPKMAAVASTLNAAQTDLLNRCTQLIATGIQLQSGGATVPSSSLGLSSSQLAGVLGTLSQQQAIAQGSNAVEAAPNQARIVSRLVALRRGAGSQIIAGGKEFNLSGKGSRTGQALVPTLTGGGASADQASPGRLGLWLNGDGSFGDADTTQNQVGYSYHTAGLTAGADYRLTDNLVLGAAFNYLRTNATFVSTLGTADSQGYGGVLYGTYYIGGFHLDLNGGFTWNNYDITRNIVYAGVGPSFTVVNRTATGSPSGQEYNINFGLGYDFAVKGFTLTPYLRVEYLNLVTESYTETGALGLNLQVVGQRVQSLLTVLGGQVSYAWSVPFGVLSPYVRAEWRHEFLNDPRSITAQFVNDPFGTSFLIPTDSPTRNYADVGAGVSAQFAKGISAFLSFDTILGLSNFTNYQFVGGLRFELF